MAEDAEIVIAAAIKEVEDVIIAETKAIKIEAETATTEAEVATTEATIADRMVVLSLFLKKHLFLLDLLPLTINMARNLEENLKEEESELSDVADANYIK